MTLTSSTMVPLGTPLPDFRLPDVDGRPVTPADFDGDRALLVAFICNHCPYTRNILPSFVDLANEYRDKGLATIAINSNDAGQHPEDGPEKMVEEARKWNFPFPYLFDRYQDVAKAFRAACTPDFFLYDTDRRLAYRGRFDDSRPDNEVAPNGQQLRAAADSVLQNRNGPQPQKPSVGCNIKWRAGNAPDYFAAA